jgi:hypothetical protein
MTDQTARLLRDAENYLSALHGSVARHDNLAANFGCAGCELRDRLTAALPAAPAVPAGQASATGRAGDAFEADADSKTDPKADSKAAADRAAVLTDAERTMLAYALDEAQEHIWSRDGFTDQDQAAVTSLRRMVAAPAVVSAVPGQADNETTDGCNCPHPTDEHSVYGCADGCGCEWMPKKPPMDPIHILGIEAERDDPTQCSGEEGFCPEHGFHRHSLKQPAVAPPAEAADTEPRPCRTFVSGGAVWCCEEGETDCPCVCHKPVAGAQQPKEA